MKNNAWKTLLYTSLLLQKGQLLLLLRQLITELSNISKPEVSNQITCEYIHFYTAENLTVNCNCDVKHIAYALLLNFAYKTKEETKQKIQNRQ